MHEAIPEGQEIDLIVLHADDEPRGEQWLADVKSRFNVRNSWLVECGPIGTHAGPGTMSVAWRPVSGAVEMRSSPVARRGRRLKTVPACQPGQRLTGVREALFSILGESAQRCQSVDLFAGAGNPGIEAYQGAARCVFVDTDRAVCRVIRENLESLGFAGSALVLCGAPSTGAAQPGQRGSCSGVRLTWCSPIPRTGWSMGSASRTRRCRRRYPETRLIVVEHSSRTESAPVPDGMEPHQAEHAVTPVSASTSSRGDVHMTVAICPGLRPGHQWTPGRD